MAKSQKRTKSNNNSKKKLPWVSMQMYRVPLNPEQAVLACCSSASRIKIVSTNQCDMLCGAMSSAFPSS